MNAQKTSIEIDVDWKVVIMSVKSELSGISQISDSFFISAFCSHRTSDAFTSFFLNGAVTLAAAIERGAIQDSDDANALLSFVGKRMLGKLKKNMSSESVMLLPNVEIMESISSSDTDYLSPVLNAVMPAYLFKKFRSGSLSDVEIENGKFARLENAISAIRSKDDLFELCKMHSAVAGYESVLDLLARSVMKVWVGSNLEESSNYHLFQGQVYEMCRAASEQLLDEKRPVFQYRSFIRLFWDDVNDKSYDFFSAATAATAASGESDDTFAMFMQLLTSSELGIIDGKFIKDAISLLDYYLYLLTPQ